MRRDVLFVVLFAALIAAVPSLAGTIELKGDFIQGGLVVGRTQPGAKAALDGKAVRVSATGAFLVGFGRDAAPEARLSVTFPDGSQATRTLAIKRRKYAVQKIDGLPERKVTPAPEDLARIRQDNAMIGGVRERDTDRAYFASGFDWPVRGPLSGVFGSQRVLNGKPKRPHNGSDVAAPHGSPITAPADGVVALAVPDMFYTGMTVMLDHGFGLTTVYAHMSAISVTKGQLVKKGKPIGRVGKTGRVTGAHLHWGATLFGTHLDPALLAGPMAGGGK